MRYLLRSNTSYEHLAKKFKRTVLTCIGRDDSEMAVCLRRFFVRCRLYELASTFCDVPPSLEIVPGSQLQEFTNLVLVYC